jgi:hypothetical protein
MPMHRAAVSPLWLRLCLYGLFGFFYIDGFLRGASALPFAFFGAAGVFLLLGVVSSLRAVRAPAAPRMADMVAAAAAACAVALVVRGWHIEPVLAAAVIGVVVSVPAWGTAALAFAPAAYAGTFVGMTSPLVLDGYAWIAAAGAFAGLLCSALRATWVGVGGKLGLMAFAAVTIVEPVALLAGASPGGAELITLTLADQIAVLLVAPAAAAATFALRRNAGWHPVLASAGVTTAFTLVMVIVGAESPFILAPAAIACFGGSFVGMTSDEYATGRLAAPIASGFLYGILQIGFEPALAGIGGDFGATAAVSVLIVFGVQRLARRQRPIAVEELP